MAHLTLLLALASAWGQDHGAPPAPPSVEPPPPAGATATDDPSAGAPQARRYLSSPVLGDAPPTAITSAPEVHDLVAGNVSVTPDGATVKASVVPFAFLKHYVPVLHDFKLSVSGDSKTQFAVAASLGYATSSRRLHPDSEWWADHALDCAAAAAESSAALDEARAGLLGVLRARQADFPDDAALLTHAQRVRAATPDREEPAGLAQAVDAFAEAWGARGDGEAKCLLGEVQRWYVHEAFDDAAGVAVDGGLELFPAVREPRDADGDDPTPHVVKKWSVGAAFNWHPSDRFGVWLKAGYRRERPGTTVADLEGSWADANLTLAGSFPYGKVQVDGFQPSVVVGGVGEYARCVAGSCTTDLSKSYGDEAKALAVEDQWAATPFVDFRTSAKVQVRLGVPLRFTRLDDAPVEGREERVVLTVLPTVPLAVTSWSAGR